MFWSLQNVLKFVNTDWSLQKLIEISKKWLKFAKMFSIKFAKIFEVCKNGLYFAKLGCSFWKMLWNWFEIDVCKMFWSLHKLIEVCKSWLKFAKMFWKLQKLIKVCKNILRLKKVFEVFKNWLKLAKIFWSLQKLIEVYKKWLKFA